MHFNVKKVITFLAWLRFSVQNQQEHMCNVYKFSLVLLVRFEHLPVLTKGSVSNVCCSLVSGLSFSDLYIHRKITNVYKCHFEQIYKVLIEQLNSINNIQWGHKSEMMLKTCFYHFSNLINFF